ncbi:PD-(D/E)XK nuclease family protein [Leptospira stimsonii]|uniref:Nuclease n=1 Tax=Leptospira stimsonii TaxID=2202203 RepID=A0ABY2N5R2_9LEPT|nr:PD-(D/E)XK nuclease family protein [Leptospira stimsonii]TGK10381.1 nuclease [Leptospira stimsonii]TGM17275.1 nuclease [Leptospira stimsonii]
MYLKVAQSNEFREKLDQYGIEHLSASSLNEYINSPAKWVMKYILKHKTTGPSMWRGLAIENAIKNLVLSNEIGLPFSIDQAIASGFNVFNQSEEMYLKSKEGAVSEKYSEKREKEFSFIEPSIRSGYEYFSKIPKAVFQKRFEFDLGIEIPAIGYIDFLPETGIVELKTSKAIPSEMKNSVKRQVALQCVATGRDAEIVYLSKPTQNKSHQGIRCFEIKLNEVQPIVDEYRMAARAIRKLIMKSDSKDEMIEFVFPNYDDFMWDEEEKEIARTIWRFEAA